MNLEPAPRAMGTGSEQGWLRFESSTNTSYKYLSPLSRCSLLNSDLKYFKEWNAAVYPLLLYEFFSSSRDFDLICQIAGSNFRSTNATKDHPISMVLNYK